MKKFYSKEIIIMAGQNYQAAFESFNSKYHIDFNVAQQYDLQRRLSGLDSFSFNADPRTTEKKIYSEVLASTLNVYLENKTKAVPEGTYTTSDFSLVSFLEDFDKLMGAIRTDEAIENNKTYTHVQCRSRGLLLVTVQKCGRELKRG